MRSVETLDLLRRESGLALVRGVLREDRSRVLVLIADAPTPQREASQRIEREFTLRDVLDPAWAAKPIALLEEEGLPVLLLADPGGDLLGRHVGAPWEIGAFLRLAIALCEALHGAHARGLIHRDVKPANILFEVGRGRAWLTGFSVACTEPQASKRHDEKEMIVGSWPYMAPEQTGHMNRSVDARSDLYSLGIVLYELLTGAPPFRASDAFEWIHSHVARPPLPPAERQPHVPDVLSALVLKLLAKAAEDRYQSALGVAADLHRCLADWEARHRIEAFAIGSQDMPRRFALAEQIHGREKEVAILKDHYSRVLASGDSGMVLVSGDAGVGKSTLVHELRKSLAPSCSFFISGKFDQRLQDIPHATIAHAFQELIARLLNEDEATVARWRSAVREALGTSGILLVELVPELLALIGPQAPVAMVPAHEATIRFQSIFLRFAAVFARADCPLILFLDDLQWLDPGTLSLVEFLATHPDAHHLLLVGAYRHDEVPEDHPLARTLASIRATGRQIHDLRLEPISSDDVARVVRDTLHMAREPARTLGELVHRKTAGNPFFARQFLASMEEEGLLRFDAEHGAWQWDSARIARKDSTHNVVGLVARRLSRLPPQAQRALRILACLGSRADHETLAALLGGVQAMHARLRPAVAAGVLVADDGHYRFLHDRVREAAYGLIPQPMRPRRHLRIGRLLFGRLGADKSVERILAIANQINMGLPLLSCAAEREWAAGINLQAGRRAKASTAYESACRYLDAAFDALTDAGWDNQHDLAFELGMERAECELCRSNLEVASAHTATLLERALSSVEAAQALAIRMTLLMMQGDIEHAVGCALQALHLLGHPVPAQPSVEEMDAEYRAMFDVLGDRAIDSLVDLPLLTDAQTRVAMAIMIKLGLTSYYTDQTLYQTVMFRLVRLTMLHGHGEWSPLAYSGMAICLGPVFQRFSDAEAFIRLSFAITHRHGFAARLASLHTLLQQTILWTRPIAEAIDCLDTGFKVALEAGDLVFACYTREHRLTDLVTAGRPLDDIWRESLASVDFVRKSRFNHVVHTISSLQLYVQALRGRPAGEAPIDEAALEAEIRGIGLPVVRCFHLILQLQRHYLLGRPEMALELIAEIEPILWSSRYHIQFATFCFYQALVAASMCERVTEDRRAALRTTLADNVALLARWTRSCPPTFAHKLALLQAEAARLDGRDIEALGLYEQAIRLAAQEGFIQEQAIAGELAAAFCNVRGLANTATGYLAGARTAYFRWGAQVKVAQLDGSVAEDAPIPPPVADPPRESPFDLEALDLSAIVEISHTLSGELVFDRLVEKLMTIAMTHASATRGLLVCLSPDGQRVTAEATAPAAGIVVRLLDRSLRSADLPHGLLEEVMRTRQGVVVDDLRTATAFAQDEYFRARPARSVLCLPLVKQADLLGALYLEHGNRTHVFTPARYAALALLSAQAAISLQTAALYTRLQHENIERRQSEEALRRSQDRYALAMEAVADGHAEWNARTGEFHASPRLLDQWGREPDAGHSRREHVLDAFPLHPDDREQVAALLEHALARGTRRIEFDARILRDGEVRWMHTSVLQDRDASGTLLRIVSASTDITERMQAESELRLSEERYALALAGSNESIFEWDLRSQHIFLAPRTQELLGLVPGEAWRSREEWMTLVQIHPEDVARHRAAMEAHLAGVKSRYDVEVRIQSPSGIRWIHPRGTVLRDAGGKASRVVGSLGDITAWKRQQQEMLQLESRLRAAERLEAMGTLAGDIAHDFNNILGALLGFGERALQATAEGSRLHRDLRNVVDAGERGRALAERILSFSRSTGGDRTVVHAERAVHEALDLLRTELPDRIVLRCHLQAGHAAVLANAGQVHQLVMNLGMNAAQAMAGAGTLTVSLHALDTSESRAARVGTVAAGAWVVLRVADEGTGITPEIMGRIFEPLFTTRDADGGIGLGLALVMRIVMQAGGAIDLESRPGVGSVFTVYLPRVGDATDAPTGDRPALPRGRGQRVVVVDERAALREQTTHALDELGYEPGSFDSTSAALAAFRSDPDGVDVLIAGLVRPDPAGHALVVEVRRSSPLLPIVVVRVNAEGMQSGGMNNGLADEILDEPISIESLAACLKRLLP